MENTCNGVTQRREVLDSHDSLAFFLIPCRHGIGVQLMTLNDLFEAKHDLALVSYDDLS